MIFRHACSLVEHELQLGLQKPRAFPFLHVQLDSVTTGNEKFKKAASAETMHGKSANCAMFARLINKKLQAADREASECQRARFMREFFLGRGQLTSADTRKAAV